MAETRFDRGNVPPGFETSSKYPDGRIESAERESEFPYFRGSVRELREEVLKRIDDVEVDARINAMFAALVGNQKFSFTELVSRLLPTTNEKW
ncbi:MAG: hypothetical protein N2691_02885 [Patescibacteria group bacterium]|nr:hypothetical protein [Patescibacteria group bacterium]